MRGIEKVIMNKSKKIKITAAQRKKEAAFRAGRGAFEGASLKEGGIPESGKSLDFLAHGSGQPFG